MKHFQADDKLTVKGDGLGCFVNFDKVVRRDEELIIYERGQLRLGFLSDRGRIL